MGKIYDVFNFFNELELLEIRLHELDDFVDQFVLVESTSTFQNNPKELVYDKNKHLFSKWEDRITHVIVEDSPDTDDSWAVETFQFNAGNRGLTNLKDDDIIMWCCTDEIPKKSSVAQVIQDGIRNPMMMMQYGLGAYLNCWFKQEEWWTGSRLVTGRQWMNSQDQYAEFRKNWLGYQVQDGGWHFCNMGGWERFRLKIQSFAHKEFNHAAFIDETNLKRRFEDCYNLYDTETQHQMTLMPWEMLPKYIADNKEKFSNLLIPNG